MAVAVEVQTEVSGGDGKRVVGVAFRESPETLVDSAPEEKCLALNLGKWQDKYFPGTQPSHFATQSEPHPLPSQTVREWGGFITVSMSEENEDKVLVGQNSSLQGSLVAANASIEMSRDSNANFLGKLQQKSEEEHAQMAEFEKPIEALHERFSERFSVLEEVARRTGDGLREEMRLLRVQLIEARRVFNHQVNFAKKVKRRVVLEEARKRVLEVLGREKGDETWQDFVRLLSDADWELLGLENERVKALLEGGAFPLDRLVHNIPPYETVDSIFVAGLEDKEAWIHLIRFAYPLEYESAEKEFFNV